MKGLSLLFFPPSFIIGVQLQDMTVLIYSYVISLSYSVPGGDL